MIKKYIHNLTKRARSVRWIDVGTISIFFVMLAIALFFFLRRTEYITVRLRVTQSDGLELWSMPPNWYANTLKPGMEDTDFFGRSIIKIDRIISGFPEDNEQKTYIDLRIQALYNKQTKQYTYYGIPLLIGSYQRFRVNGIQIPGVIHAIGKLGITTYPQKRYVLKGFLDRRNNDWTSGITDLIEYDGIYKYVAEKIQNNMEMRQGNTVIANIIEIKKSPATKKVIQMGQVYTISDPERLRVELVVGVIVSIINGRPYFKDDQQRLIVNSQIMLDFGLVKAVMTITDIQEAK